MEIVDPCIPLDLLPQGSRAVVFAKSQPEYLPLPTIVTPMKQVISRWSPTPAERRRILEGEDIYVTIYAYGGLNPMDVSVGCLDWKA